jgi:contact-dependent growth inhibition (CDI) system CdiI-like immunity protein
MGEETRARYPALDEFFGFYLGEDWSDYSVTPAMAVDNAIAEYPITVLQQARRELAALLDSCDDDSRLRDVLNDGLGVNVRFRMPVEARSFAVEAERKLLEAIQAHYRKHRTKG